LSDNNKIKFFLASKTKRGLVPLFDELRDVKNSKKLYILKGGPGSGKNSLMKRVLMRLESNRHSIEYIHCASDPNSLDAFIDHTSGIAMVDGTSPHIMDPGYPGAYDVIINMGDCWDDASLLDHKNDIISLSDTCSTYHQMASSCIRSAAALLDNNMEIAKSYLDNEAINEFVRKLIKDLSGSKIGNLKKRLLSAVSVGEIVFFAETIENLASSIYLIPDKWGAASDALLSRLSHGASLLGIEQIVCYCSIRTEDKIDHIIFPSAGIAVSTSNCFHSLKESKQSITPNFMKSIPNQLHEQMLVHHNIAIELLDKASNHVKQAKLLHDNLEAYYIKAMDYSKVDLIYESIIKEII